MTDEEAAICLLDDPTFLSSPIAEQIKEAAYLVGPDRAAAVAELARSGASLSAPTPPPAPPPVAEQPPSPKRARRPRSVPRSSTEDILKFGGHKPGDVNILPRFKIATGMTIEEICNLLQSGQPRIHAYCAGTRKERLTRAAVRKMAERLTLQRELIDELLDHLALWKQEW